MWRGPRIYLLAKVVHWDRPYCIFDCVKVSQCRLNRYINRALHYLACLLCTKAVANALSKGSLPVSPYNCRFPLFTETSSLSLIRRCNRHLHSNYQSRCELHASGRNQLAGWFLHAHVGRWGNNQVQQVALRTHWVHVSDSNTLASTHREETGKSI